MTDKFNKLIGFILKHEGGYVNDPIDPGGETNMGISKRSYPNEDIKNMTVERASEIYFRDYWTPLNCDNYEDNKLALALFDSAVNCGTGSVQKWVSELGNQITYKNILLKRLRRYANICQKNPKMSKFLLGWIIRILHIHEWE